MKKLIIGVEEKSMAMKRIIDFMVAVYTLILPERDKEKCIGIGVYVLNLFLSMNVFSLLCFFIHFFGSLVHISSMLSKCILIGFTFFVIHTLLEKILEKHYLGKYEYIRECFISVPKIVMGIIIVVHIPITIFFSVYCLKYILL